MIIDTSRPIVTFPEGQPAIYCQPCKVFHELILEAEVHNQGQMWIWNGDRHLPTFWPMGKFKLRQGHLCHFQVTDGRITYQPDSTHAYAGQTHNLQAAP